jgi:hypothetical protein
VRTTLTLDEDVSNLLNKEIRRSGEPMKQAVNRLLHCGLAQAATPSKPKRFVVKPIDTGLTSAQWAAWDGMKMEEILEQAEISVTR